MRRRAGLLAPRRLRRHYARDARGTNQTDDDRDGLVDEHDECITFTQCVDEQR